jgi:hypothetical protein
MKRRVYWHMIEHRHGVDVGLAGSAEARLAQEFGFVTQWAEEADQRNGHDGDAPAVRQLVDADKRAEAVERYFAIQNEWDEFLTEGDAEVDFPEA